MKEKQQQLDRVVTTEIFWTEVILDRDDFDHELQRANGVASVSQTNTSSAFKNFSASKMDKAEVGRRMYITQLTWQPEEA